MPRSMGKGQTGGNAMSREQIILEDTLVALRDAGYPQPENIEEIGVGIGN